MSNTRLPARLQRRGYKQEMTAAFDDCSAELQDARAELSKVPERCSSSYGPEVVMAWSITSYVIAWYLIVHY